MNAIKKIVKLCIYQVFSTIYLFNINIKFKQFFVYKL